MKRLVIIGGILLIWTFNVFAQEMNDPYIWLEKVKSKVVLDWVDVHNKKTIFDLKTNPVFDTIYSKNLEIYSSKERIDDISLNGDYIYNLLQDEVHKLGIWQRMLLISYVNGKSDWETLLDLDSLSKSEGRKWIFRGAQFLSPEYTNCIIRLSDSGSDASGIREFDVESKTFIHDGFYLPFSQRTYFEYRDINTLYLATDFDEDSLSQYGRPFMIKSWKRGSSLKDARVLFKGNKTDRIVFPKVVFSPKRTYDMMIQILRSGERRVFTLVDNNLIRWNIPSNSRICHLDDLIIILLNSDWQIDDKTYLQGSLISIDFDDFLDGDRNFDIILTPNARSHIWYINDTYNWLLTIELQNARSVLYRYKLQREEWIKERINTPEHSTLHLKSSAQTEFFFTGEGFLQPSTLYYVGVEGAVESVKREREFFNTEPYTVKQFEAISLDGTHVPYYIVEARDIKYNGINPTLLYGYGAVGIPMLPSYNPIVGTAWLERGGVYVVANIRGGGELGPDWHLSAVREKRQRSFDDFIAVAEDLITRGITSPRHLGIMGHSGGGLLVGAVFIQRPDLFNAVVCMNPPLDMKKSVLVEEYGDPNNPDDWSYMKKYSPYHNLSTEQSYPTVLFITSTTDDRVIPGHARKMAAKMEDMHHDVYFYEAEEGGHNSGVTPGQKAFRDALIYAYLLKYLR